MKQQIGTTFSSIAVIGVPYNQDHVRVGMGLAPEALLAAGLRETITSAGWPLGEVTLVELPDYEAPREARIGALMALVGAAIRTARAADSFPLVVGGDCLTALGAITGLGGGATTGIAWVDAHGDFNTPATTLSGYLGGMPLACVVGRGLTELRLGAGLHEAIPETNAVLFDARDLDPPEAEALHASQVLHIPSADLTNEDGLAPALARLAQIEQLDLHIDIDVLDSSIAAAVDFPTSGGLTIVQLQTLATKIVQLGNLACATLTAVNPAKDRDQQTVRAGLQVIKAIIQSLAERRA
jgi:arginase